MKKKSAFLVNE